MSEYYVYILANDTRTLYTGVSNNIYRRMFEHKHHLVPGFSSKYNITQLVHVESTSDVRAAISREKQIKGWARQKKIALIEETNPKWLDLSLEWRDLLLTLRDEPPNRVGASDRENRWSGQSGGTAEHV